MMNISPLLIDLYQLTMLQGYMEQEMEETAVFEFFVRKLPRGRNFLLAAGLAQVLDFLEKISFASKEIDFLREQKIFNDKFLEHLALFRFRGEVHAMAEGTPFFPDEPILQIVAPIAQAQLVETRVINILQFQTMIASKAARLTLTAPEKLLVDFGLRRAHGAEAGLFAARASYMAGFAGSSTVLAGQVYGIPIFGTMAHSFIQAHDSETSAFEHFAQAQPGNCALLIDTYDTERGAYKVVELAPRLAEQGIKIKAVRLDSGDMIVHSRNVRRIFDQAGLQEIKIFTSGNLDEYRLAEFADAKAPIDGFGVGTRMSTSADAPYLDCAYKLVEYGGVARRKRSEGKATWPGQKQVFRHYDQQGEMSGDLLTVKGECHLGSSLIKPVMSKGRCLDGLPTLNESRQYALAQLARLPVSLQSIKQSNNYPVEVSPSLLDLARQVDARTS